jgi:hypothetical protein
MPFQLITVLATTPRTAPLSSVATAGGAPGAWGDAVPAVTAIQDANTATTSLEVRSEVFMRVGD